MLFSHPQSCRKDPKALCCRHDGDRGANSTERKHTVGIVIVFDSKNEVVKIKFSP